MPVFEVGPIDEKAIYAFLLGVIITFVIMGIRILAIKSHNKKIIKNLKASLNSRIELEATSMGNLKKEIEGLQKKNENLNTSIQNLSIKAGRRERLQLQVYQTAIEKMSVRAPGFAPAWHIVLKECEEEIGKSLNGTIPFVKRIIPAVGTGWKDSSYEITQNKVINEEPDNSVLSGKYKNNKKKKFLSRITSFFSR